ncbi:MAG TPA: hypothetical protein DCZ55_12730 [Cyanobacteria bacterium UBA11371]|nr:hypothetical protein [Cyanobacteria bacterium UBA11371]
MILSPLAKVVQVFLTGVGAGFTRDTLLVAPSISKPAPLFATDATGHDTSHSLIIGFPPIAHDQ